MYLRISFLLLLLCFEILNAQIHPPAHLQNYYHNINFNKSGTPLLEDLAVETITKHTNILEYSQRHQYLYIADQDSNNSNNVVLIYNGQSSDKREYLSGSNTYNPQTFNTEHVYPQSLINNTAKGDLHHLRSCDITINNTRGNKPFTDSNSATFTEIDSKWFPGDVWKGDVARMIFYLNIRYNEPFDDIGSLELFLKWNSEDPVSEFEKQRNEVIYTAQGNRNPFIDNPYIATLIWGGLPAENTWATLTTSTKKTDNLYKIPNPIKNSKVYFNNTVPLNIEIYNVLGKKIKTVKIFDNSSYLDTSNLNKGLYILKIYFGNNSITKKIVKI